MSSSEVCRGQNVEMQAESQSLVADFFWNKEPGSIRVECVTNDDPPFWGCWSATAEGFPVCTATVDYPARGYRSMLGWVQLVRSTDNESAGEAFEIDPFALFGDAPSPYCWYGQRPTLFDAPSRSQRKSLEWAAHSFLAATPLQEVAELQPRRVVPLVGFSWGFTDTGSRVTHHDVALLPERAWDSHLDVLRQTYPLWVFSPSQAEEAST
jgi:hypothetical protein